MKVGKSQLQYSEKVKALRYWPSLSWWMRTLRYRYLLIIIKLILFNPNHSNIHPSLHWYCTLQTPDVAVFDLDLIYFCRDSFRVLLNSPKAVTSWSHSRSHAIRVPLNRTVPCVVCRIVHRACLDPMEMVELWIVIIMNAWDCLQDIKAVLRWKADKSNSSVRTFRLAVQFALLRQAVRVILL